MKIKKKLTIEEMQNIAEGRGGKCLSSSYVNNSTNLLWECAKGHQWKAKPADVKRGGWCLACAGKAKGTIEEMRRIAVERGGKCLSGTYVNALTKLTWQCAEGHQWKAPPNSIKNGRWCPECSTGLGERICRVFFEQIFENKFPRSYPRWLVNKKGNQMELDGFCQSLAFAFEHHGEQHYSTKGFIKSKRDLKKRQEEDRFKRELCHQQGVMLIEVPEIPNRLSIGEIKTFIKKECNANSVSLPSDYDTKEVNLMKAYTTSGARASLEEIQNIAEGRGGKCLSGTYVNALTKLTWQCAEGHQWEAIPNSVKRGSWCLACAGKAKGTIEEMQKIAEERGGKCLSNSYVNKSTKLLWECKEGHQWEATPNNVKRGSWCLVCAGNAKGTIEEMRRIAVEHDGKCLSDTYVHAHLKLLWQCAEGHQWKAPSNSVKRSRWCPHCAGIAKLTIEEMQNIAEERGGKCLSDTYVNSKTKLLWECKEGHQWEAIPK